jgi:hypothetical protein
MRSLWVALIVALTLFTVTAMAADVSGVWKAQMPGRDGETREVTFNFKQSGETLTGTTSGFRGADVQISDGKVSGDEISFTVVREFQGNTMKMLYKGKIVGGEIQFKMQREGSDREREFTAKKVS